MHPRFHIKREEKNELYCGYGTAAVSTAFHFHSQIELYLIEAGTVDVWVNQKQKRLTSGEIAVSLGYDTHRYEPVSQEGTVICLIIPANLCKELNGKTVSNPFIYDPVLFSSIRQCCSIISQKRNNLLTNGCIQVICGLLLEKMEFTQREVVADPDSITQVLLYLSGHFKEDISLTSVAGTFGFNASYLSRHFKESLGIGFNQYLTMLRLREAVLLLSEGTSAELSAYESGFTSSRTFYRCFYKEFGCTPREYAKSIGGGSGAV